jgi:hypothetical protein
MKTKARKRYLDFDDEWNVVERLLPRGWQEKAKELGAVRRLRGVDSVETLLRMLLVHLADGCSLKETSLRAGRLGWGSISAVGLFKRLRAAEKWLAWMAKELCPKNPLRDAGAIAVDATTVMEAGPTGALWRAHWSIDLSTFQCQFFELTDARGGEKLARFPIHPNQLVMGDRAYGTPAGIEHARDHGGHVLIRVSPSSFPVYAGKNGRRLNVMARVSKMKVGEIRAIKTWVQGPAGGWYQGRLVAIKRTKAATEREVYRRLRSLSGSNRRLGPKAMAQAGYVFVWTSLPASEMSPKKALQYYRARWQLELVFKRAKSIMGLGQLPKRSDASSRAWLNGKMLVALLVEKLWQQAERFSPWGYILPRPTKPVA